MRDRAGLAARLFAAQLLTITVGAATLVVVALMVGPGQFSAHLDQAFGPLGPQSDEVRHHVVEGYTRAAVVTVGIAGLVSLAAAVAVSLLVTRRLAQPIAEVADAATRVAVGSYDTRVPDADLGPEMDHLTSAFNTMADALEDTEQSRQRLLGDVAHELRTPLATIRAYHEALADGVREPDEQTWAVLSAQTDRIQRLVDDIALVSRAEEGALALHPVRTQVAELVAAAVSAAGPGFEAKGVSLATAVAPGLRPVDVDPDRMGQVLTNLLANALRHTPAAGRVVIAAGAGDHSQHHGSEIMISVADDGDGIAPENLRHVFERFYRADPGRDRGHGGSGIGLTISRALTQAHGGTLTASSPGLGRGATFTITLPVAGRSG